MGYINTNIPELADYDSGIVLQNLDALAKKQERLLGARCAHLSELADAIMSDGEDVDTINSILLTLRHEDADISNSDEMKFLINTDLFERLYIYRHIIKKQLSNDKIFDDTIEMLTLNNEISTDAQGRVAYMKSGVASKAYLEFSKNIKNARATEFYSFEDACAEVANGNCEYCILPTHGSDTGKLHGIMRLIIKYSLKIFAVCNVSSASGRSSSQMQLALLKKDLQLPDLYEKNITKEDLKRLLSYPEEHVFIEVSHSCEETNASSLTRLLAAAEFLGMSLVRIDTAAGNYGEYPLPALSLSHDKQVTFDMIGGDILTFFKYLSLEAPDDTVVGIYKEI